MCSLVALFNAPSPIEDHHLVHWCASMRERGPDGEGTWIDNTRRSALGHVRLAIIDPDERAAQPMCDAKTNTRIVFNGEIYNYRQIRTELESADHVFSTESDTEVILRGYLAWGAEVFKRLRGMYAIVIVDPRDNSITAARDPFGIKPLYYYYHNGSLAFASQMRTLTKVLEDQKLPITKSVEAAASFAQWGSIREPLTTIDGAYSLPSGGLLRFDSKSAPNVSVAIDIAHELTHCPQAPIDQAAFNHALNDSIEHHMVADVEVGVFLSAGLDSSTIAALAATHHRAGLRTITLGFERYKNSVHDEVPIAAMIAKSIGVEHAAHYIGDNTFNAILDGFLAAIDQPSIDGLNTYLVSHAAHQAGLKCVLSGLGGDELLGGYPFTSTLSKLERTASLIHLCNPILTPLAKVLTSCGLMRAKVRELLLNPANANALYRAQRGIFMDDEVQRVFGQDIGNALRRAREQTELPINHENAFSTAAILEARGFMRNQLLKDADWASMAHSVELRVPLVDIELWRTLAAGWHNPQYTARKDWLPRAYQGEWPEGVVNRQKTGFITPVGEWLKSHSSLDNWKRFDALRKGNAHWSKRWCAEMFVRHFGELL